MTATQKTKLRAMPAEELQRRLERLQCKRGKMFWRYYFETALRKIEEMAENTKMKTLTLKQQWDAEQGMRAVRMITELREGDLQEWELSHDDRRLISKVRREIAAQEREHQAVLKSCTRRMV